MKRISFGIVCSLLALVGCAQNSLKKADSDNTLLWEISGNGLAQPSYLYGTIHMICADDATLSDNMKSAIGNVKEVYFEVDLDNMMEMLTVLNKMKMAGDTTLKDLLNDNDYQKVKAYFAEKGGMIPFDQLQKFKPLLAAATVSQNSMDCGNMAMMEQVIMEVAKKQDKKISGLESMAFQMSMFDKIPYKMQAEQLVKYIDDSKTEGKGSSDKEMQQLMDAYKGQDLKKLEELMMKSEMGMQDFTDILLVNRNKNWIVSLKTILPKKSVMIAV